MPVHMTRLALNAASTIMYDNDEGIPGERKTDVVKAIVLSGKDICSGGRQPLHSIREKIFAAGYLYVA